MPRVCLMQSKTQGQKRTAGNLVRKTETQNVCLHSAGLCLEHSGDPSVAERPGPGLGSGTTGPSPDPASAAVWLRESPALTLRLRFCFCRVERRASPPPGALVRIKRADVHKAPGTVPGAQRCSVNAGPHIPVPLFLPCLCLAV